MQTFIDQHDFVLMEAAIVEPIRRDKVVALDPQLVHGNLIYDPIGREELKRLYVSYATIARDADLPFLMCTPTWRTNSERVRTADANPHINRDAVKFLLEIREELGDERVRIGGLVSCKNDCYQPKDSLAADESEAFHTWQIDELAESGVDFLFAATLPSVAEAIGIAKAMSKTGVPYFISFVIDRSGQLLDGTTLSNAVQTIDLETPHMPIGYLVNCAYPTFLCAADQPTGLYSRLIGFQGNASSLDHCELDCAEELQMDDVAEWGDEMLSLYRNHGMKILGGCCGTNAEHLRYIAENANLPSSKKIDTKTPS